MSLVVFRSIYLHSFFFILRSVSIHVEYPPQILLDLLESPVSVWSIES